MSILHLLLINLVVVVSGTPVTRYATFRNLDMTSSCHVGVLSKKDQAGTTWVIQSNGNGTYSMTWDEYARKWGSHKIKLSEWMDSVSGTTLEGAVEVGNLNYDDLLDKCYDVRDAVVGYLSGRNDSLSILTAQTCPPNKRYCGHDPEARSMEVEIHSQRQKLLISCGDDGRVAKVDICDRNCTSNRDKAGDARCKCSPHKSYCASELSALGGWMEYDNHILYLCLDGINISIMDRCSNGCIAIGNDSICSGHCTQNISYCGHKLLEMGLRGYDPNGLYQCEASGQSARIIANCSDGCSETTPENVAVCLCHPGRIYCMHDIYTQLNWQEARKDEDATDSRSTALCLPDRTTVNKTYCIIRKEADMLVSVFGFRNLSLSPCIASQGEKDAYCQWTAGIHCGRELNAMGWTGYENDILYQCGEKERNVTIISQCPNGTCQGGSCQQTCIPNRTYCGYQLYLMGWARFMLDTKDLLMFGQCNKAGQDVERISICNRCTNSEGHARCVCEDTQLYCGHELAYDDELANNLPYDPNALYRCNNGTNGEASLVKVCKRSCVRVEREPVCQGECFPGDTYCGSKLLALGFTGYNMSSMYTCSTDGRNFNDTGLVDSLCIQCTPDQGYCGHQLQRKQYIAEGDLQWLYKCRHGSLKPMMPCDKCIINSSTGAGAYCQCIPGTLFCVGQISDETFLHSNNFTIDTLFRCTKQHKIEFVEQCPYRMCKNSLSIGQSYCLCTPHRNYCGHQLKPNYNSPDTYLSLNHIYQCSAKRDKVVPIRECASTCVLINGEPECREQCVHGSRYCGSDLLRFEGWTAMESNVLYQCTNGSFASPELNCTQGCRGKNGDVDAYCLGMPTPWYWILLATGLPLLFISLCLWLIRTIIKHRRLQLFVQQHRINNSQLILVEKLGEGQFGEVWKSRYTDPSGQQMDVAVKISKHHLNTNDGQNLASANCFFQESVALDFLRHQNITRALGICSNLKMAGGITTPALVLEYMNGGNSADYVLTEREHLQTSDLMRIFIHVCHAGEHLQKMGVIHRDIGARNVLIRKHSRNGKPEVAKLTDFGLAKDVGKAGLYRCTNSDRAMFQPRFTAPEGFRIGGEFTSQSDVWSFGVFMWELYMLMDGSQSRSLVPYSGISSGEILVEIQNGHRLRRPNRAPTDIYSIMTSCWTWMPESRPTFRQLRKILLAKRTCNEQELEQQNQENGYMSNSREAETTFSDRRAPINENYGHPIH